MRKKAAIISLIILLELSCCFFSFADDASMKNGAFSFELKGNGTAVITGFDWDSNNHNDIYIPKLIDGHQVSEIGAYAFSSKDFSDQSTSEGIQFVPGSIGESVVVVIPDTVTVIGEKAFYCTKVQAVTIPASVEFIGSGAFAGCTSIENHNVDSNNKVYTTIKGVLYDKTKKELVSFPAGRKNYYKAEMPEGITSVGEFAYAGCTPTVVSFPSSLVKVGDYAFYHTDVTGVYLSRLSNVKKIGDYSFAYCHINLGNTVIENVGAYAFFNADISDSGKDKTARESERLLFGSVKTIGDHAFSNAKLTLDTGKIAFPSSLVEIGEYAFWGISPASNYRQYYHMDFSQTKLTSIPEYAFSKAVIDFLYLPETITQIERFAFSRCKVQARIRIPNNVTAIDEHAFEYSSAELKEGSKIKSIGDYAFYNSTGVGGLPEGLVSIGEKAFWFDGSNRKVSIPSTVTSIGDDVCNRSGTILIVVPDSYGAQYASDNGYQIEGAEEDLSWLGN